MKNKLLCGDVFKKVLSMVLVCIMVLSLVPAAVFAADGTTLYLTPDANWKADNARFAVYYWNDSSNAWTDMSDADGDGVYEVEIPAGYTDIIFCRMNPATTENNWDNKWNQSTDLTVPTDGTNMYVIELPWGTEENGWQTTGHWETYTTDTVLYLAPCAEWLADGARFATYYWDDNGSHWADMTDTDGDGKYEITIPEGYTNIIFCRMNPATTENNWDNKWNQTTDLTVPTDGTNMYVIELPWGNEGNGWQTTGHWETFTPEDEEPEDPGEPAPAGTYYVAGTASLCGVEWSADAAQNKMTWNGTAFEKVYTNVAAGTYQFKITAGNWDNAWGDGGNNYTFEVTSACDVTITFDPDTKEITVTGDGVGAVTGIDISYMTAVGAGKGSFLNGKNWAVADSSNRMTASGSVYTITYEGVAAGTYEVKFAANGSWNDNWGSNGSAYTGGETEAVYNGQNIKFTVSETSDVTLELDLTKFKYESKNGATYTITVTASGEPTDPSEPTEPDVPEGDTKVTLHFMKPDAWSCVNAYLWISSGAVPGYTEYNAWPGKAISDADSDGWYDLVVVTDSAFNFIFNDGSSQTADLKTPEITGNTELWVMGNDVFTEQPKNTVLIHFQKPASWNNSINAYSWDADGNQLLGVWPGTAASANTDNSGWYDTTIEVASNDSLGVIFNDGANQTGDLQTGKLKFKTELWIYADQTVSAEMPADWSNTNLPIFVPGTFPGPSWDPGANQMTYDAELDLYVYTFEDVPAANYQFKIAINGSWDENYGMGGVRDGDNYSVTVPETMDVTVYYNHKTHNAVTSVTYKFVEVSVSGTGIETTDLTDEGLTGIYSGTVSMKAGTYTDVVITCDGKEYAFAEFTIEEDKDVTFYIDPTTGIFYHNGSDVPIDTDSIYFNSQDENYKAPFGAVEEGEEVTFAIDTGDDITSAVLVIKGVESYPMTKDETTGKWTATASIAKLGEYDYYFVMSNGSGVAVYGDDDGYYGEGTVTDLTGVMPYDLVVYEAGFETPDWMKNAVIYQIFPDRFFDGDEYITDWYTLPENPEQESLLDEETYKSTGAHYGDGEWSNEIYGGDLQGIIEKIDYLKALGVNVIYLNPVFWSISNHRYDAVDYTEIDPILGTLGDFEELVAVAEANDMHIILDGVFNHVSDDSVYFDRYYKFLPDAAEKFDGKIGAYPYWAYVYDYMAENGVEQAVAEEAAVAYFSENYGITDYSYTEWFAVSSETMTAVDNIGLRAGKEVYSYEGWWGYDSMPVIYSTNGSEYQTGNWAEEIISGEESVNAYWISKGMDGWRLDVANEVSDETWQNFRDSVKALDSEAVIIGEIWDDATKYLMGDMYDSVMNYQFRNAVTAFVMNNISAEQAAKQLEKIRERYPEEAFYAMMNLVGSHDTTRILSYLDGIGDDRAQKDLESAFPTYEGTSHYAKEKQYTVALTQFTYPGAPTIYYGDEIGMVGSDDPDDRRAFEWGMGNEELVTWYATLAAIREAYPALRTGSIEMMDIGYEEVLSYWRCDGETEILVLANRNAEGEGSKAIAFNMPEDKSDVWVDVLSGMEYDLTDNRKITMGASVSAILVPKEAVVEITVDQENLAQAYDPAYIVAERDPNGHEHSYEVTETVDATCTEDGYVVYTCSCGDSYTETIESAGHNHQAVVTEPTCTEQGYTTYTCSCGDTYVDDYVDATGHNYKKVYSWGRMVYKCTECGHTKPVTIIGQINKWFQFIFWWM